MKKEIYSCIQTLDFTHFFPIIYHLIKKTKKPVNKEKNYLFSDHLTRHERCMYIEVWVTVKCWAFINNKEMYLRRLEWTLPECCSPLDWWNDLMIYKEAVKGSQQELAQQFERRRLLKGEERTCRRSRKHQQQEKSEEIVVGYQEKGEITWCSLNSDKLLDAGYPALKCTETRSNTSSYIYYYFENELLMLRQSK